MISYEQKAKNELKKWQKKMLAPPSITNQISKGIQRKVNQIIPDRIHSIITSAIKNMSKTVLLGSEIISKEPLKDVSMEELDELLRSKIKSYRKTAVATGAWSGAGGMLLRFAEFPILLSIKIKFLYDAAVIYGYDVSNYKERLFILHVFQLAFSSHETRRKVYSLIANWDKISEELPEDINLFDWHNFQQEYRDYIDMAKLLQLLPVIGSFVGAYANFKFINKLGETAIYAYRLRVYHMSET